MENSNGVPEVSAPADKTAMVELQVGMWIRPKADMDIGGTVAWPAKVVEILRDAGHACLLDSQGTLFTDKTERIGLWFELLQCFEVVAIGDPQ